MLRFVKPTQVAASPVTAVEQFAAAVAVGLYLDGIWPLSVEETAAAVAVALHLSQAQPAQGVRVGPPPASVWAVSGRLQQMGIRGARQERARLSAVG